jgi:dolichyl-phosphate-mannose-protein mannosyltransferase
LSQIAADADARRPGAGLRGDLSSRALAVAGHPYITLALIVGACIAVYAPALNDWFQTDDYLLLRAGTLYDFPRYLREAFDFRDFEPLHFLNYRPLYFSTSKVMFNVFGLEPLPWHAVSLVLHCANAIMVWHICRRLSGSVMAAHVAAGIFALHPVFTTTVSWISGYNSVTATTCQLACVLAFLRFLDEEKLRWYGASLGAYTVGILFHQEIFLVCGVIYVYYLLNEVHDIRQVADSRALRIFVPFATVMTAWLVIQGWNAHESGFISLFEPSTRNIKGMVGMIGISIYPRDMGHLRAIHGVLTSVALGVCVILATNAGPRWRVFAFCGVWYGASLLLVLLYFGKTDITILAAFPRKVYPAGPALAIVLAMCLETVWGFAKSKLPAAVSLTLAVVLVAGAVLAFRQANEYVRESDRLAIEAEAYSVALKHKYPSIAPGATLHLAAVPKSLILYCPFPCYVGDLVITEYGRIVPIEFIDPKQASDPAYLASLPPNDAVFCYQCP